MQLASMPDFLPTGDHIFQWPLITDQHIIISEYQYDHTLLFSPCPILCSALPYSSSAHTYHCIQHFSVFLSFGRVFSRDKNLNIIWTGYAKRTPIVLFNVSSVLLKRTNFKTVGGKILVSSFCSTFTGLFLLFLLASFLQFFSPYFFFFFFFFLVFFFSFFFSLIFCLSPFLSFSVSQYYFTLVVGV